MQIKGGANLSGARLFARLERLGSYNKFAQSEKLWNLRLNLFKEKDRELLDGDLTEFLVTGYMYREERHSLIGLTCDGKKLRERLKATIRGVRYVNKILGDRERKVELPFRTPDRIPIHPGIMIVVDQHRKNPTEKIDVRQLIAEIDAENDGNPTELSIE